MSSEEETHGKKRKSGEESGEASSSADGGCGEVSSSVDGVQTEDGLAWDLGGSKVLRVKDFKGKTYVDIREYYEDKTTGEKKPTKKGVMINVDQFEKLTASLDSIKKAVYASAEK
jgi:hypothetical protein